jgi:hypothetical protein
MNIKQFVFILLQVKFLGVVVIIVVVVEGFGVAKNINKYYYLIVNNEQK